jgi:hypothetical protein
LKVVEEGANVPFTNESERTIEERCERASEWDDKEGMPVAVLLP